MASKAYTKKFLGLTELFSSHQKISTQHYDAVQLEPIATNATSPSPSSTVTHIFEDGTGRSEAKIELLPNKGTRKAKGTHKGKWRITSERHTNRPAWFTTLSAGLGLVTAVLIVNTSILGWVLSRFPPDEQGTSILFSGSCDKTATLITVAHLIINTLSTLLIAAGNYCAQILLAPTRSETDQAHQRGHWAYFGAYGIRNIRCVKWWRVALAGILFFSSVPLHLLSDNLALLTITSC